MSSGKVIFAFANIILVALLAAAFWWPQATHERKTNWVGAPGPVQPIAFYHDVHVEELHIPCAYCHYAAMESRIANVPPVELCWGCHRDISITHPEIQKLRAYYIAQKPIPWVRINQEPEYVHFSHSIHIAENVPCDKCHGDVGAMHVVYQPVEMNMGWCVSCHRQNQKKFHPKQAAVDCQTCHY